MSCISYDTATQLAYAYREIETGERLLSEMRETITRAKNLDYRDPFGQRRNIQLQVPASSLTRDSLTSRLFDIKPDLAVAVIEAHVAECKARLMVLCEKAKTEMESGVAA